MAAWCALDIVRTRHLAPADQPIDYERLIRDYADVYQRYPQSPAGEEAFLYGSSLSLPSADPEQARKLLEKINEFLSSHPKTPYLSQFYGLIADCYRKMDEQDQRIQYLIKALDARPVDPQVRSTIARPHIGTSRTPPNSKQGILPWLGNTTGASWTNIPRMSGYLVSERLLERMDAIEAALREGRNPGQNLVGGAPGSSPAKVEK